MTIGQTRRRSNPVGSGAVLLLLLALVTSRPSILGELYTSAALGLAIAAVLLAVNDDGAVRFSRHTVSLVGLLMLAQAWLLLRRGDTGQAVDPRATLILLVALLATSVVLSDRNRAIAFGRLFVWTVLVLCVFCCVTTALFFAGIRLPLFTFFTGQWTATVFFPFTPSIGSVWVSGQQLPRFSGIGREPGWMGMYIAFAAVAWRWVGRPRWWGYLAMTGALLCTLSTAGFGIFIVVVAYEIFLRRRGHDSAWARCARFVTGIALMAGATWLALYAPVVGLLAKSDVNALSLDERSYVMTAGFEALTRLSLGAPTGYANDGIGLVAATAASGWPYFLLVSLAFLLPLACTRRNPPVAMVMVLYLTILLAQPPQDSVSVYVLLLAAFSITSPPLTASSDARGGLRPHGASADQGATNAPRASAHIR